MVRNELKTRGLSDIPTPKLIELLEKFYSNFVVNDKTVSVIEFNPEWYEVLNPTWLALVNEVRSRIIAFP